MKKLLVMASLFGSLIANANLINKDDFTRVFKGRCPGSHVAVVALSPEVKVDKKGNFEITILFNKKVCNLELRAQSLTEISSDDKMEFLALEDNLDVVYSELIDLQPYKTINLNNKSKTELKDMLNGSFASAGKDFSRSFNTMTKRQLQILLNAILDGDKDASTVSLSKVTVKGEVRNILSGKEKNKLNKSLSILKKTVLVFYFEGGIAVPYDLNLEVRNLGDFTDYMRIY